VKRRWRTERGSELGVVSRRIGISRSNSNMIGTGIISNVISLATGDRIFVYFFCYKRLRSWGLKSTHDLLISKQYDDAKEEKILRICERPSYKVLTPCGSNRHSFIIKYGHPQGINTTTRPKSASVCGADYAINLSERRRERSFLDSFYLRLFLLFRFLA